MWEAFAEEKEPSESADGSAAEAAKEKPRQLSKTRVNHLGVPLHSGSLKKYYKYQRTATLVYGGGTREITERESAMRVWRLLMDTKPVIDQTLVGLRRLFDIFVDAEATPGHSLFGPRAFRLALERYGVRDTVLVRRLFDEFCEKEDEEEDTPRLIEVRQFLRILISVNKEPIEDRLSLLYDLWDVDNSLTLSHKELLTHVVYDLPVYKKDIAFNAFNRVWQQVRGFAQEQDGLEGSRAKANKSGEVTKDDLIASCQKLQAVANFFEEFLVRRMPKAENEERPHLKSRMSQLDAEVREEVRNETRRPGTAPAVSKKEAAGARAREARNMIMESLKDANKSAVGVMNLNRPRMLAKTEFHPRPKTASERALHSFVTGRAGGGSSTTITQLPRSTTQSLFNKPQVGNSPWKPPVRSESSPLLNVGAGGTSIMAMRRGESLTGPRLSKESMMVPGPRR